MRSPAPSRVALSIVVLTVALRADAAAAGPLFELRAHRSATPPVIDGVVGDAEWAAAAVAGPFIQFEPRRGEPASYRTEARVLHDDGHLYVAFRAWDPESPTAQVTQRDQLNFNSDDVVAFYLDTYHDRRTAYYFMTNLRGTQSDGRFGDDGKSVDNSWDAAWTSAARRTEYGWSAEFAVPLTSIKYDAGSNMTWGINFGRSRRRSLEISAWTGPLEAMGRISQGGALQGLELPAQSRRHQIIPYGLVRAQEDTRSDWDAGLDVRYALTPKMAVYGTVLPDFATIEADQEQINLTRFEISLREKRQFFLEGQELFNQRIRTFYSRRVADIRAGAKLYGKQGAWTVALQSAQSDPIDADRTANYSVARVQRDVLGSSNVAVMLANRRFGGLNQGSLGVDANLLFTKTFGMTAQIVKSHGVYGRGVFAGFVRPSYDSATGHFHVRYTHLGDRFADNANAIGFIQDDNRREVDSAVEKTIWIRSGALERLRYDSNYNAYWGQDRNLRSWQIDQGLTADWRNRLSLTLDFQEEFKRFEKDFRNRGAGLVVGFNTRQYQSVRAGYSRGRNFDSDFDLWTAAARYKVTAELSAEYELQRLFLDPDPDDASTWIHVVRANQAFTRDLYLQVFFQTNSAIDRRNVQAVFVYRYRPPFGTLQLAYQRGTAAFGQRSGQGHTLFVKTTTVF
jgi:hypothetical protein